MAKDNTEEATTKEVDHTIPVTQVERVIQDTRKDLARATKEEKAKEAPVGHVEDLISNESARTRAKEKEAITVKPKEETGMEKE